MTSAFLLLFCLLGASQAVEHRDVPRSTLAARELGYDLDAIVEVIEAPSLDELLESLTPILEIPDLLTKIEEGVPAELPPWPQDVMQNAAELETRLEELRGTGGYGEALVLAEELVDLCEKAGGAEHWCTGDALRRVDRLRQLAAADPAQAKVQEKHRNILDRIELLSFRSEKSEALQLALAQLEWVRTEAPSDPLMRAAALQSLARALELFGEYERSGLAYRGALSLQSGVLEPLHPELSTSLHKIAYTLRAFGDHEHSLRLYSKSVEGFLRIYGSEHQVIATAISGMTTGLDMRGDFARAERAHRLILKIFEANDLTRSRSFAMAQEGLAETLTSAGDLDAAEEVRRASVETYRRTFGDDDPHTSMAMGSLANLLLKRGDLLEAEELHREVLGRYRARPETLPYFLATELNRFGMVLRSMDKLDEAEAILREAVAIFHETYGETHFLYAKSLHDLGTVLSRKGDFRGAEPLLRQSVEILRDRLSEDHEWVGTSMVNLAGALDLGNKFEESLAIYEEVLAIRDRTGGLDQDASGILHNMAELMLNFGDFEAAESFSKRSYEQARQHYGAEHPSVALALSALGARRQDAGDLAGAEKLYRESRAMYRRVLTEQNRLTARNDLNLSVCLEDQGRFAEALPVLQEAFEFIDQRRTRVIGAERERALFEQQMQHSVLAAGLARNLIELGKPEEALMAAERGRGRVLLDLIARSAFDLLAEAGKADADLREHLTEERRARNDLSIKENTLAALNANAEIPEERKLALERDVAKARLALSDSESEVLSGLRGVWRDTQSASVAEMRASLDAREVLLHFLWSDRGVALFVLPASGEGDVQAMFLARGKQGVNELSEQVHSLRGRLATPPTSNTREPKLRADLAQLHERLLPESVRQHFESVPRWVVVADGPLTSFPLAALARPGEALGDETYLVTSPVDIVYEASGSTRARRGVQSDVRQESDVPWKATVLGDPRYSAVHGEPVEALSATRGERLERSSISALDQVRLFGERLDALPATRTEAVSIAHRIRAAGGEVDLLMDENASVPELERAALGTRFLHLATHGLMGSSSRPGDASLALTQPERPTPNDLGFLTLDHLLRRWRGRLNGCELVVLSACDSLRGPQVGTTRMSLPWGFFYAGAPAVVASLWKVDDHATALLMIRFYENLLGTFEETRAVGEETFAPGAALPKSLALREAKVWLQSATRKELRTVEQALSGATRGPGGDSNRTLDASALRPYSDPYFWSGFVLMGDPH